MARVVSQGHLHTGDWKGEGLPIPASVVEADKRERDGDGCWVSQSLVSVIMNFTKVFAD